MKFDVWIDGHGVCRPVEAGDADEAASVAAEQAYNDSGGEVPESHGYDVVVRAPDGTITRHDVTIVFSVDFCTESHREQPGPLAVAALTLTALP